MKVFCLPVACVMLLAGLLPSAASGDVCHTRSATVVQSYQAAPVATANYATNYNQNAVAVVPLYVFGATYYPPPQLPTAEQTEAKDKDADKKDSELRDTLKALVEQQKRTNDILERLGQPASPPAVLPPLIPKAVAPPPPPPDPMVILKTACASCHTGDKSKAGFILYTDKGEMVRLSGPDRREMVAHIAGQKSVMPPPPAKLTPEQKSVLTAALK